MGDTISSLVFRPPNPTPIHPSEYFYLDVDVHSQLCTNKSHPPRSTTGELDGSARDHGSCGGSAMMCLDTGESDLASLDTSFIKNDSAATSAAASMGCYAASTIESPSGTVSNMRNGQIYKIPAFFIRRRNATQTLLFSHGNAEDLGMMYNRMKDLAMVLGVNIMAYDYTGYGLSIPGPAHGNKNDNSNGSNGSGSAIEGPSENMIYRNIEAAFHYLTKVRKIPPHQIILYGRSLGSGPSCYLAAKSALNGESVGGLILHSPFLSVYKVVADLNGLDLGIVGDLFHNEKRAKNVRCPTLIIHGKEDEVVPFWHAPRLLAAIPPEFRAQPFYAENMGHNHIESRCRDQYVKVVLNFLRMGVCQNSWAAVDGQPKGCTQNYGGYSKSTALANDAPYRGPRPIPIHERAAPSETKENASFYVNRTWLRHAKHLLKEVFSDTGCYVNSVDSNNNDTRWEQRSTKSVKSGNSGVASAPSSRSRGNASTSSKRQNEVDRYSKGQSDARDDEDEFAPWRGSNQRPASAAVSNSSQQSHQKQLHSQQQQKQQHYTKSAPEKILTARPDNNNSNHRSTTSEGYHKTQSLNIHNHNVAMDKIGQQFIPSNDAPRNTRRGYGKSKSMALLEGMSRQRRF